MEEKFKVEHGSEKNFYSVNGGNDFGIAFNVLFQQEKLGIYNLFEMNSKRNFKNLTTSILGSYREIFLKGNKLNEELEIVLFNILNVKSKLMTEETTLESFTSMIDRITDSNDRLLVKAIDKYVEKNYSLDLDKITRETKEKKKKVNEELQFSDAHARLLIKIAYLYRIMIPIISVYFTYNKSLFAKNQTEAESSDFEDLQFEEINETLFAYLFEKFTKKAESLKNKLYKLTYSRVSRTSYSDKRFWNAAKSHGITKDTVTLDIYKKLLTNAIPKLVIDKEKNIVSFFQSVVNNQIDFLFQNKFKTRFIMLGETSEKYSDDDEQTSEFERLEIQMLRKDEGMFIIRKLSIEQAIDKISEAFEVEVTDKEVKQEARFTNRNSIQEDILSLITYKYFDDKQAIKFLTFYQYVKVLILVRRYLANHKYTYLPQILTAKCERHKERVNITGKKAKDLIKNSQKYKVLFKDKYNYFSEEIERPLAKLIGTVYSSVFTDNTGIELFDATVKVPKIADELLDLAYLI
jgi:hypothetical protein